MRRRGVIARELRRFVEALAKTRYAPKQEDIRALAEFVHATQRAVWEEASAFFGVAASSSLDEGLAESRDLQSVQAAFASAIYSMATSNETLRERLGSALGDLVPFMSQRPVPDETTAITWQALMLPLSSGPLRDVIGALPDAEVQRAATCICTIDARLRWLIR
jgi:hypothetical protein